MEKNPDREKRGKSCIEVDRKKHRNYKLFAVKKGMTLKELAEFALDAYTSNKSK